MKRLYIFRQEKDKNRDTANNALSRPVNTLEILWGVRVFAPKTGTNHLFQHFSEETTDNRY